MMYTPLQFLPQQLQQPLLLIDVGISKVDDFQLPCKLASWRLYIAPQDKDLLPLKKSAWKRRFWGEWSLFSWWWCNFWGKQRSGWKSSFFPVGSISILCGFSLPAFQITKRVHPKLPIRPTDLIIRKLRNASRDSDAFFPWHFSVEPWGPWG